MSGVSASPSSEGGAPASGSGEAPSGPPATLSFPPPLFVPPPPPASRPDPDVCACVFVSTKGAQGSLPAVGLAIFDARGLSLRAIDYDDDHDFGRTLELLRAARPARVALQAVGGSGGGGGGASGGEALGAVDPERRRLVRAVRSSTSPAPALHELGRQSFESSGVLSDAARLSGAASAERVRGAVEGAQGGGACASAVAGVLSLSEACARPELLGRVSVETLRDPRRARLDASAREALGAFCDGRGDEGFSLFALLDRCRTKDGSRLLRSWLAAPLTDLSALHARQAAVLALHRDGGARAALRDSLLRGLPDVWALVRRLERGKASLQDLCQLYRASARVPGALDALQSVAGLEEEEREKGQDDGTGGLGDFGGSATARQSGERGERWPGIDAAAREALRAAWRARGVAEEHDAGVPSAPSKGSAKAVLSSSPSAASLPPLSSSSSPSASPFASPFGSLIALLTQLRSPGALPRFEELLEAAVDLDRVPDEYVISPAYDAALGDLRAACDACEREIERCAASIAEDLGLQLGKSVKLETFKPGGAGAGGGGAAGGGGSGAVRCLRVTGKEERGVREALRRKYVELETRKDGVKFTSAPLRRAADRLSGLQRDYESTQAALAAQVADVAASFSLAWRRAADALATLDALQALAEAAASAPSPWTLPRLLPLGAGRLAFLGMRHPCVEARAPAGGYVPNDLVMANIDVRGSTDGGQKVVTGPNMGGKSTHVRAAGCCALLAQIGALVPCRAAELSVRDGVFARVGAGDSAARGVSTFMAEMLEAGTLLRASGAGSLVLVDELGRGTSTADGLGLAAAVARALLDANAAALFATHFHELADLALGDPRVAVCHVRAVVDAKTQRVAMLHAVRPGPCDDSFGLHVAKVAGFPESVLKDAERVAGRDATGETTGSGAAAAAEAEAEAPGGEGDRDGNAPDGVRGTAVGGREGAEAEPLPLASKRGALDAELPVVGAPTAPASGAERNAAKRRAIAAAAEGGVPPALVAALRALAALPTDDRAAAQAWAAQAKAALQEAGV